MFESSQKKLVGLILTLFLVCLVYLAYRMLEKGDELSQTRYVDQAWVEQMGQLISSGAIYWSKDQAAVDESRLKALGLDDIRRKKVHSLLLFVERDSQGKLWFDPDAVKVTNPRLLRQGMDVLRGRILDRNQAVLAETRLDDKTGRPDRFYPLGPAGFHPLGSFSAVYGRRGLEASLDDYLSGTAHSAIIYQVIKFYRSYRVGDDAVLTIDARLQQKTYDSLLKKGVSRGAAVALDPKTGAILAMASVPSFDPNTGEGIKWIRAERDPQKPFLNRAISELYPPGSTFKIVTASAWLEQEQQNKNYTRDCDGYNRTYHIREIGSPPIAHGKNINLEHALTVSCNVYFADLGAKLGKALYQYAGRFGFNQGLDLVPDQNEALFPVETSLAFESYQFHTKTDKDGRSYTTRTLVPPEPRFFERNPKLSAQAGIGQNLIQATVLQMALAAAAVANNGIIMKPCLVKEIRFGKLPDKDKSGWAYRRFDSGEWSRPISRETAEQLAKMMENVTGFGTARNLPKIYRVGNDYILGKPAQAAKIVIVAAKTGTAEVGDLNNNGKIDANERPHSWFVCFAPAEDPRVVIAVLAENSGYGSQIAGPIAMEIMAEALKDIPAR